MKNLLDQKVEVIEHFLSVVDEFSMKKSFHVIPNSIVYFDLSYGIPDDTIMDIKFNGDKVKFISEVEKYINDNLIGEFQKMGLIADLHRESGNDHECILLFIGQPRMSNHEFAISIGD